MRGGINAAFHMYLKENMFNQLDKSSDWGHFPFTSPRRQARQRFFTLAQTPDGDALSFNGNSGISGDTGFAG